MNETLDGLQPYQIRSCEGFGCLNPRFMFVGISAGKLGALKTNVPFTKDGSGRLLQRTLNKLGLSKSDEFSIKPELVDCWITNLVKGRVLDNKGNNRLPDKDEIQYWLDDFTKEVQRVKPKMIIALGKLVYEEIVLKFDNVKLAYHPRWYFSHGAINSNSKAFQNMVNDYMKVLEL